MKNRDSVHRPINFNCWKHHADFIKEQIQTTKTIQDINELNHHLLKIGESQMDLYYGGVSPREISEKIIDQLKLEKLFTPEKYKKWILENGNNYRKLTLSDNSTWILRLGEGIEKYVHIHPGRSSPHTIRVKANTLKTVILILSFKQIGKTKLIETEAVNYIRKKYLNEPPLKSLSKASGMLRLMNILSQ